MNWQYTTHSCDVIAYATLTSTSRPGFCTSSLCSWTNASQFWNTSLYRPPSEKTQAWSFRRHFLPQIYATYLLGINLSKTLVALLHRLPRHNLRHTRP